MALSKETILNVVGSVYPDYTIYEHRNQLSIIVDKKHLIEVATALRDNPDTLFNELLDVTAIDWLKDQNRFEVVYILYSLEHKGRVRLKVPVDIHDLNVPTVYGIWQSANWYERETYDMYGIHFTGHPDMRRFYMPEDYVDPSSGEPLHPLRKDFPLMGIPDSLAMPPYPEKYGDVV